MQVYYFDSDGDGYGINFYTTLCRSTPPPGFSSNNTDCNDNNAAIHSPQNYYQDLDGDGYGSGVTAQFCQLTAPNGFSIQTGDCNDEDPLVNPGSVDVCGNNKDDNCNGQVDEAGCYPCQNATAFNTTNISQASALLEWTSVPNPIEWLVQYKALGPGSSSLIQVVLTGNKRSHKLEGLLPGQNYVWQLRAKCGKNFTENSGANQFTTLSQAITQNRNTISGETAIVADRLKAWVLNNPSNDQFTVIIEETDQRKPIKMTVFYMNGKLIEEKTIVGKMLNIGSQYKTGGYIVNLVNGTSNMQLKLIKL